MSRVWPKLLVVHLVPLPWVGGWHEVQLTPAQAERYASEPAAVIAQALGCSVEDYLTWLEWHGRAQCIGKTAKGKRCRATVPNLSFRTPAEFAAFGGGYCGTHDPR